MFYASQTGVILSLVVRASICPDSMRSVFSRRELSVDQREMMIEVKSEVQFNAPRQGIGVVAPYDFALDDEYCRWVGSDVSIYATRTPYLELEVSLEMAEAVCSHEEVTSGARSLIAAHPSAVLYACTSGSFVGGRAGERALRQAIEDAAGIPAVTTSGAMLAALETLGVQHVAIATPYDRPVSDQLAKFVTESGYDVVGGAFLGLSSRIAQVDSATVLRLAQAADSEDAEVVFLSCTNLRTIDVLAKIEEDLGKPVLSANQVSLWAALRAGGLSGTLCAGSLGR